MVRGVTGQRYAPYIEPAAAEAHHDGGITQRRRADPGVCRDVIHVEIRIGAVNGAARETATPDVDATVKILGLGPGTPGVRRRGRSPEPGVRRGVIDREPGQKSRITARGGGLDVDDGGVEAVADGVVRQRLIADQLAVHSRWRFGGPSISPGIVGIEPRTVTGAAAGVKSRSEERRVGKEW